SRPLRKYLLYYKHGLIFIITRNKKAALELAKRNNIITVEPIKKAYILAFYKKKLGTQENRGDIAKLIAALRYIPLTII
ncbi:uncharacterized protein BDZ99DRAFT_375580, partial [Mytilinidion resinicola]